MDSTFMNMDDTVDSFLDLPGTPRSTGSDVSFFEDGNMFSGDSSPCLFTSPGMAASQAPGKRKKPEEKMTPSHDDSQLFMSPGPVATPTPAKKKKKKQQHEEKMTPGAGETSFFSISSAPDDLFLAPESAATETPAKENNSSFSSTAPTPKMRSSAPARPDKKTITIEERSGQEKPSEVGPRKKKQMVSNIPVAATPTAAERKDDPPNEKQMEDQVKEVPTNIKELIDSQMKKILDSMLSLQSLQVEGGEQLLAKVAAVREEVTAYEEKLTNLKEQYKDRANLALKYLYPTSK